ncbi:MAG TPA: ATP-binding protein, partial [bacterium]|nr:ATP-binding protein [bacterium]
FDRMVKNLYSYHISIKETNKILGQKIARLRSVQEISEAILGPYELEQVLYMVLTALTAGEGFGFNRAFLFLVNSTEEFLAGKMAVGPYDHEEAMRIWGRFPKEKRPLKELMRVWDKIWLESKINQAVKPIRFRLNSQDNVLVQSLMENMIINVPDVSSDKRAWPIAEGIKTNAFAVLPLVKDERRIGVVVVDNFVTRAPIPDEDLEPIAPFTSFVAIAIHTAALNDQLRRQVTDLDKAHKRLRSQRQIIARSQQLAQMGRLTADLAHEIRNPMTLIGGFARVLVQKLPKQGELHDNAQIIADEVSRLEQLLNNALKMTMDETPRYEPGNITFLIMETLNLISSECEKKSIRIVKNLKDDLPLMLLDRQKLKEVFINLLQNAIQSMPDGGTITVSSVRQDGNLQLSISDTGVGIKESEKEFIFNPFYTSSPGGTGLGLPLANRIVEAMSGSISMESKVGQGSTFRLTIPIRKVETKKPTPLAKLAHEA